MKLVGFHTVIGLSAEFPRPNGRGLIEAAFHLGVSGIANPFPRPNGRGLIEAMIRRFALLKLGRFPRPNGRGLIEASVLALGRRRRITHFRDLTVAA